MMNSITSSRTAGHNQRRLPIVTHRYPQAYLEHPHSIATMEVMRILCAHRHTHHHGLWFLSWDSLKISLISSQIEMHDNYYTCIGIWNNKCYDLGWETSTSIMLSVVYWRASNIRRVEKYVGGGWFQTVHPRDSCHCAYNILHHGVLILTSLGWGNSGWNH